MAESSSSPKADATGGTHMAVPEPQGAKADTRSYPYPSEVAPAGEARVEVGVRFGRYHLLRELGKGGMGIVYEAWDPDLGRKVALKRLLRTESASDEVHIAMLRREARAAARLRHPHVVAIHEVGECEGRDYFTMDLIEGETLEDRLGADARSRLEENLAILVTVAEAVAAAHAQGIVHRDLKPGNILLDGKGNPFVTDFGLAKHLTGADAANTLTASGHVVGTTRYMAPEQAYGRPATPASDVYALGVILYEAMTGVVPHDVEHLSQLIDAFAHRNLVAPRKRDSDLPIDLETICLRCLEFRPALRYGDAAALADDLRRFRAGEPIAAQRPSLWYRMRRAAGRNRALSLALAGALLLSVALGIATTLAAGGRSNLARTEAEADAERLLLQAEGLWREAKLVLYRTDIPVARHHDKLHAALAIYEQAIARAPHYGWIYESRGRLHIQTRRFAAAEADLRLAVDRLGPESGLAARRSLGRLFLERSVDLLYGPDRGGPAQAQRAARLREAALTELNSSAAATQWRGTQEEGENARAMALGLQALTLGLESRALEIFRRGYEQRGDEECAWGASLACTGSERSAWREKALQARPRYARALVDRGAEALQRGDPARAVSDLTLALEIDPDSALAHINRGIARNATGDAEGARADFDAAVRLDPQGPYGYVNRGTFRLRAGDRSGARTDLDIAIRLDADDPRAYSNRALLNQTEGRLPEALADYAEAVRLDPRHAPIHFNRGLARQAGGDLEGAIRDWTAAIELEPSMADAWASRGSARYLRGDKDGARADFDAAIRACPDFALGHMNRAALRLEAGDLEGARADLDSALRLDPAQPLALVNRGSVREGLQDPAGAAEDYRAALELAPPDWSLRPTVEQLLQRAERNAQKPPK